MINLKELNHEQLISKAEEIRSEIINVVSKNGGHLSSNLGIVELTMAIHKNFDLPNDTLIFDVSHQSYAHKILSGRCEDFKNLRRYQGISGFTNPNESNYDAFSIGHSSTAVSLAIGTAIRNKKLGINNYVIAVVGDASATNGLTLEALNFLGAHPELKVIIIINDNEMSVSKNVGAVARTFNKIRIKRKKAFVYKISPKFMHGFFDKIKNSIKGIVYKKSLFDSFNLKYFQGIDGHNFKELDKYLNFAKNYDKSVVLHVKTIKGKGYKYAEVDQTGYWHNVEPFDIESGLPLITKEEKPVGYYLSKVLIEEQKINDNIKVIDAAMTLGNSLTEFQTAFPNDLIDVGIAEENAVTIASSIASKEIIPIVFIYSTFLQRAYDEILHDVVRCNKHVVFCIDRSGIVPHDGSTHQGIFDLSYLIPMPNLKILAPSTTKEAEECLKYALTFDGPIAIRYPKYLPFDDVEINDLNWKIELSINKVNVITYGSDVLPLKEYLKDQNVGLINAVSIKPLDYNILEQLKTSEKIIIYEQVNNVAGLFDLVNNYYAKEKCLIKLKQIALNDTFLCDGSIEELKEYANITYKEILNEIE